MLERYEKYKGIHPGVIIERELKKRSLRQRPFALSIEEHPQTFNAITKGKRNMNTALALKIEEKLDMEEGTMMILQVYYDIKKEKQKQQTAQPNLSILRKSLFWDTDITDIDWKKQADTVIRRVFERGNEEEKKEVIRFYGRPKIKAVVGTTASDYQLPLSGLQKNQ